MTNNDQLWGGGDGQPDILLGNAAQGWSGIWTMKGTSVSGWVPLPYANGALPVGVGDFNGDGQDDIILANAAQGWSGIWTMNSTNPVAWTPLPYASGALPVGVGDFSGDGQDDIILANAAQGWSGIWTMNGTNPVGWTPLPYANGALPVGVGDFNGVTYKAGAASVDITPADWAQRTYWLAGFDPTRPATSVHDPLYARTLVVDDGTTPMAIVTLDLLGMVSDDIQIIQDAITAKVPELGGRILVHTTHDHEAPDTIGLWGGRGFLPFFNPRPLDYIQAIGTKVAEAVERSWNSREAVSLKVANIDGSILQDLVVDDRPPYVADPFAHLLILSTKDRVLGTLINWASHPEVLGDQNQAITADFVKGVVDETEAQLGGTALFVNGAIGGLLTSSDPNILPELPDKSFQKAEVIGREVSSRLLQRVMNPGETDQVETLTTAPPISYAQREFYMPVENPLLLTAKASNRIPTTLYPQDEIPVQEQWRSSSDLLTSYIKTESNFITLGPISILTMGGELYPELLVGGIDPSIGIPPNNQSPLEVPLELNPNWDDSPYKFFFGLTNDFTGYVIPQSEWDGSFGGYYGEQFATSADGGSILSYNLHLLMLGYQTGAYPDNLPTFLSEPNRQGYSTGVSNNLGLAGLSGLVSQAF